MHKDFDGWNLLKRHLHENAMNCFYHEREIWWCSLGVNIGFEEDGKGGQAERPVLIIRAFNRHLCWIVPLSTSLKPNPFYVPLGIVEDRPSSAMISQMRPIDTKRLINRVCYLDEGAFNRTKQAIKDLL